MQGTKRFPQKKNDPYVCSSLFQGSAFKMLLVFLMMIPFQANAGVYKCVKENGEVEFRDHACHAMHPEHSFLPYTYHKTNPKVVRIQEKEVQKTKKKIAIQEKREARTKVRLAKKTEKEKQKADRLKIRCENTKEKIKSIQSRLRAGCKSNRNFQLKEQLLHLEKMKQKYCQGG